MNLSVDPPPPPQPLRERLVASLAFPGLLVAAFLLWEGWKAPAPGAPRLPFWQVGLYTVGALLALAIAVRGFRTRYRGR